jgi:hypothetical protein
MRVPRGASERDCCGPTTMGGYTHSGCAGKHFFALAAADKPFLLQSVGKHFQVLVSDV